MVTKFEKTYSDDKCDEFEVEVNKSKYKVKFSFGENDITYLLNLLVKQENNTLE